MSAALATPSAASAANPSPLPSRYSIRQLTTTDVDAAMAIMCHSNCFYSPVWSVIYPDHAKLAMDMFRVKYLAKHQIDSGLSYGVFDTQYQYKRPESAATQGAVYWDVDSPAKDAATLLEQMDFPLVSVALAYDQFYPLDMAQLAPLVELLPQFGIFYHVLAAADKRNSTDWTATAPGQVMMRNGTSTRADYEGQGIMTSLAHWLMREAKLKGFRGIAMESMHDAVTKAWMHPPAQFHTELVSSFDTAAYEQEGPDGVKTNPFSPAKIMATKMYVTL